MRKFKHAFLLDDLTVISDSFHHNFEIFIKKPKLSFTRWDRIRGAWGVLTGIFYPVYFAEDYFKEAKETEQ